jgi:hypothetical protein
MYTFNKLTTAIALSLALTACGGGGGGGSSDSSSSNPSTQPEAPSSGGNDGSGGSPTNNALMTPTGELSGPQTGSLQDAPVEGLTYWTASNGLGQTGENGTFNFVPGEVIALYIGNELMILTDAELYSTPLDVLSVRNITQPGEGHPHMALNVLRLLQTIDINPDEAVITIPDSFHADRNGTVLGLNFAQETDAFAASPEVAQILTEAGKQGESLVDRSVAAEHLERTLAGLENNQIDLRGTWMGTTTYLDHFGAMPQLSCLAVGPATWEIGDETVFLHGDELGSNTSGGITNCFARDYGTQDTSDWPGVSSATRDGVDGVEWNIADNGALDFDCGPVCTLAELRGTIDDWEEVCLADDFYATKSSGDMIDFNADTDYCAESDQHNGPVVGYSEVTYADRLGGDRMLRIKRDFFASFAPAPIAERADTFMENGLTLDVISRKEALEYTLDLTQGTWEEKIISSTDTQTVDGGTYTFPADAAALPLTCANGLSACRWSELNSDYDDGTGNRVEFIHVRGTNIINWVEGDTVGTLTRID